MFDPSMDPTVIQAAKKAGLDHVEDLNHNGKIDVQDVALAKAAQANTVQPSIPAAEEIK